MNDGEAIHAALQAGLGKSLLPVALGDRQQGIFRLCRENYLACDVCPMVHPDPRELVRILAVIDWLDGLV